MRGEERAGDKRVRKRCKRTGKMGIGYSSKLNDRLFKNVLNKIKVGMTEKEVRSMLLKEFADSDAEGPSFDPIVASGPSGSNPHWTASERKIKSNEMVTIDMGVFYKGFASDMTRTFVVNGKVSSEEEKIWNIVKESMEKSIEAIKPGVKCSDLFNISMEVIEGYGYGKYFTHSLGHGLGVEVHDYPSLSSKSNAILQPGMVITIEPGIYIPGKYGVRLEVAVLVTDSGYEVLNETPIELYINK